MNTKLTFLAICIIALSSCSTLYKAGQTPDDVYYSPVRSYGGGSTETRKEAQREESGYYNSDYRSIRLGINDRRFRNFDYFYNDYAYNPYNYGFNYGYYYNPYFWPYPVYTIYSPVFIAPSNPKITTPRVGNLNSYGTNYNNNPVNSKAGFTRPTRSYNNNNNARKGSTFGNVMRQVIAPSNSNNNGNRRVESVNPTNNNNNTRSYTPSSSSSSSSGSSSSGGGVSRPARGGGN